MHTRSPGLLLFLLLLAAPGIAQAQFYDPFEGDEIDGWFFFTGDGEATMDFVQHDGYARVLVDATADAHNVWWAIIKRDVSADVDLRRLAEPGYELRVEARVRVSHAPRRLNFMINTQRTTDFHEHLKEYDLPDATGWHTISMTTRNLDAVPGDTLYVQLGVTDWGLERYHVDLDYYRADVVDARTAAPDVGEPLPYHPPVPPLRAFARTLAPAHDAVIGADFPDVNFNDWHARTWPDDDRSGDAQEHRVPVLTVGARQWPVLRWDFGAYAGAAVEGAALLELTPHSVVRGGDYVGRYGEDLGMEFGKVRVVEIVGGDPGWDQRNVTYASLTEGRAAHDVFNSQMVFDADVTETTGGKVYVTLSRPVMQRLLEGATKGLVLMPLGAIQASFYASEAGERGPKLHFNLRQTQGE